MFGSLPSKDKKPPRGSAPWAALLLARGRPVLFAGLQNPGCVDPGCAHGAEPRQLGRHQARHVGRIWPTCFSRVLAKVVLIVIQQVMTILFQGASEINWSAGMLAGSDQ